MVSTIRALCRVPRKRELYLAIFRFRKTVMRFDRVLSTVGVLCIGVVAACGAGSAPEAEVSVASVAQAVSIPKTYTRKIFAHMMPWFTVGGQHWSMNSRNSATGVASWYAPMIGEYSSDDGNVIE